MAARGRVFVVGAGLAGLACAWRLSRRGFDVAVCERRQRPGGRARSVRVEGFSIDAGWPVLSGADRELLAWADEVGLRDDLLPLRPVVRALADGAGLREVGERGWLDVARTPGVRILEALRLRRLGRLLGRYAAHLGERPGDCAPLDDRSVADFARLYFGRGALDRWVAPRLTAQLLADPEQTSRALFLRRYRRQGAARVGLPRAPLGDLPDAAADRLKVLYDARVDGIVHGRGGLLRVTLSRNDQERIHDADAVVLATPAPEALRLADPVLVSAERDFLARVRYAPSLLLAAGLRRPLHPHPLLAAVPRDLGSPLGAVLLEPGVSGGRVPHGRGLALLRAAPDWAAGQQGAPDEAVEKELLGAFAHFQPGLRAALLFTRVLRQPGAQPCFDVGRYRELDRFERVQADLRRQGRRLYFAGDFLEDPSWEGALVSARRAGEALDADFSAAE